MYAAPWGTPCVLNLERMAASNDLKCPIEDAWLRSASRSPSIMGGKLNNTGLTIPLRPRRCLWKSFSALLEIAYELYPGILARRLKPSIALPLSGHEKNLRSGIVILILEGGGSSAPVASQKLSVHPS